MLYITTALLAEAKPIVDTYKLKLIVQAPFAIYRGENLTLVITGMGSAKALMGTTFMLTRFTPALSDVVINFGIVGSTYPIGTPLLAHSLGCDTHTYYPDMRVVHPFVETALFTSNVPHVGTSIHESVDMEAFYVMQAALYFVTSSQIAIIKVVSDNFSDAIPSKEYVGALLKPHIQDALAYAQALEASLPQPLMFSATLHAQIQQLTTALMLTKAQQDTLNDALKGYILQHGKEPLLPMHCSTTHKKEQKDAYAKLLKQFFT